MPASAIAFLEEAVAALPFRIERLLTDRGSCFTADGFETACREHKIEYRRTRSLDSNIYSAVDLFNGLVQCKAFDIKPYRHDGIESLQAGHNVDFNRRRQRALKTLSSDIVLRQRLKDKPDLASPPSHPADPTAIERPLEIAAAANEVSQSDS